MEKLKKKKLQNKVAFVSVRSDGELEGNALALYPYIKGEKAICAYKLPHDNEAALTMSEAILTNKVIVTGRLCQVPKVLSSSSGTTCHSALACLRRI